MEDKLEEDLPIYKLLSINRVSKMLGIRHANVKKLISNGKIKGIEISEKRIMISYQNLLDFLKGENVKNENQNNKTISIEETQSKIDLLFKKYENL